MGDRDDIIMAMDQRKENSEHTLKIITTTTILHQVSHIITAKRLIENFET